MPSERSGMVRTGLEVAGTTTAAEAAEEEFDEDEEEEEKLESGSW